MKRLEIGVADASKAKGGQAVNPFQTKADDSPDAVRFNCLAGSYHIMDAVATGLDSHAHHQAIIDERIIPKYGAPTTFVIDLDPISAGTFIDDVEAIGRGSADVVRAGVGVSACVPPPNPEQVGNSCYAQKLEAWNKLQQEDNRENFLQDRRDGGENSIKKRKEDLETFKDDCSGGGENSVKKRKEDLETFKDDCSRGGEKIIRKRKEKPETFKDDCSHGGRTSSNPGYGGVGKPFNSGAGVAARDNRAEGAGKEYYGLHLDIPMKDLAVRLPLLVRLDGSLKEPPLCGTNVNPDHPGLTKQKGRFGLDRAGNLIMGYHKTDKPNMCKRGGTIPVTTAKPPYAVPTFTIPPLCAGKIVSNKTYNEKERKLAQVNKE